LSYNNNIKESKLLLVLQIVVVTSGVLAVANINKKGREMSVVAFGSICVVGLGHHHHRSCVQIGAHNVHYIIHPSSFHNVDLASVKQYIINGK
jgi:precorrin-6B methylase 1